MVKEHINTNPQTQTPPVLPQTPYFIGVNGQQQGPFDFTTVEGMLNAHQIDEKTLIWKRGMVNWTPVGNVSEFNDILSNCPPPLPPL